MSVCDGGLVKLTNVPRHVLDILQKEVRSWDYINDVYRYDGAFGDFKARIYHVGAIFHHIYYPPQLLSVIDWLEKMAGPDYKAVRCFLNLMEPNQTFETHVDTLKVHVVAKRFHIPVTVSEGTTYYTYTKTNKKWIQNEHSMEYGYLYQLDNINPHKVANKNGYRINLICDLVDKNLISNDLLLTDRKQSVINQNIVNNGLALAH